MHHAYDYVSRHILQNGQCNVLRTTLFDTMMLNGLIRLWLCQDIITSHSQILTDALLQAIAYRSFHACYALQEKTTIASSSLWQDYMFMSSKLVL